MTGNAHDGLFAQHRATLFVADSLVLSNARFGAQASADSRIFIDHSALYGNAQDTNSKDTAQIALGANIITAPGESTAQLGPQPAAR
jgi:hypothetical protein